MLARGFSENLPLIRTRFQYLAVCGIIVLLAGAFRLRGGANDLWLDEVWSLKLVGSITSPCQVFTKIHHDNNHYLNGLWLYWLGPHRDPILYRWPSMAAGIGTVVLAGLIGRRRSSATGLFALVLTGFSYVLVLYSSEARGYSGVVFFAFLAYYAMDCYLERPRWTTAALYSASAVLGLASHLIFVNVLAACALWCWLRLKSIRALLVCQAAPAIFFVWLYLVDIRHMVEGGSGQAHPSLIGTYALALAWTWGVAQVIFCIMSIIIIGAAVRIQGKECPDRFLFFLSAIVLLPIFIAVVRNSQTIYVRYFLLSIAFLLLLASELLAWLFNRSATGKAACLLLLVGYGAANGWHIAELFKYGRGSYRDALHYMAEHSHGPIITIDSDNDFQVPLMLDYDTDALEGKPMEYRLKKSGPWGAEWLICQKDSLDDPTPPHGLSPESAGFQYELAASYPTAPLSGLRWYLYQRRP